MAYIPVNEPLLNGNEKKYLNECIDTGWISSEGSFVSKFEEQFASRVDRKYGIAVSNGTVALEAAVAALGLGKDDEVIMPTFTIISCAAAVIRSGATPVFIDSDPNHWNMDVQQIESKITRRTRAIMVVHIYGLPVDMNPVLELASKYGLLIIEDAAEAHGQTCYNCPCGSFGDISIFSFYPNKHLTTGEGGMIVTNNVILADRCRSLRNLCFKPEKRFVHDELGYNFRMTNLQAALGVAQLERFDEFISIKRNNGHKYQKLLSSVDWLQLPQEQTSYAENIYWVFGVVLKKEVPFDADVAMKKLADKGVGTRPFFWCMHEQPVLINMGLDLSGSFPVAENLARRGFYLPSGLALTDDQIFRVSVAIKEICS